MSGNMLEDKFIGGWLGGDQSEAFESGFAIGISLLWLDYLASRPVFLFNLGRAGGKVPQGKPSQFRSLKETSFQRPPKPPKLWPKTTGRGAKPAWAQTAMTSFA